MPGSLRERVWELLSGYQGSRVPQSFIHRALGASKSRVSEILAELERQGLIAREVVGRSKVVYVYPGFSERAREPAGRVLRLGLVYSSEYLFLGGFVKRLESRGVRVEVVVFRDGLRATRALAEGAVDMALSPLPGQLYLYPAYRTFRVVPAGVRGGFRVMASGRPGPVYSSMISTMDYARGVAVSRGLLEAEGTAYFDDPSQVSSRPPRRGFVVAWHPVYLELAGRGFKPVLGPDDLGVEFCCTLGVSNSLGGRLAAVAARAYREAVEEYGRQPDKWLEYYSALTGIELGALKNAAGEYRPAELDEKAVAGVARAVTPSIPAPAAHEGALAGEEQA